MQILPYHILHEFSLSFLSISHSKSNIYVCKANTYDMVYDIQYNIYYVANGDFQIKHSYDLSIPMLYSHDIPYNYTDGCEILIKLFVR